MVCLRLLTFFLLWKMQSGGRQGARQRAAATLTQRTLVLKPSCFTRRGATFLLVLPPHPEWSLRGGSAFLIQNPACLIQHQRKRQQTFNLYSRTILYPEHRCSRQNARKLHHTKIGKNRLQTECGNVKRKKERDRQQSWRQWKRKEHKILIVSASTTSSGKHARVSSRKKRVCM